MGSSLEALAQGMEVIAVDRGYTWQEQRADLVSRAEGIDEGLRERLNAAVTLPGLLGLLGEEAARKLISSALRAKSVTPFEMKGGRQARLFAEKIVEREGVPENFGRVLRGLQQWIETGCARGFEITMAGA